MNTIFTDHSNNDEISTQRVTISPEFATQLLANNRQNRRLNRAGGHYRSIVRALNNGEWRFNGDAIRVASDGTLLDGQHRLTAVVETGVAIDTLLVTGLPNETQLTVDTGKKRNFGDVLSMRGVQNAAIAAAITRRALIYSLYGARVAYSPAGPTLSNVELLDLYETHKSRIDRAATIAQRMYTPTRVPASLLGLLALEFDSIDVDDANYFWARLYDGAGLDADHPILTLRHSLERINNEVNTTATQEYRAAIIIKAWNFYRKGRSAKRLQYRPGGATPETFPEAI